MLDCIAILGRHEHGCTTVRTDYIRTHARVPVVTSIDQKMLRDKVVNVLTSELGGLPYRSGQGIYFIPKIGDDDDYLTTLTNYSTLLENFGSANTRQFFREQLV